MQGFRRNPNVVWRRETQGGISQGLLLFNYKTRGIHFLNEPASRVWELIEEKSLEEISYLFGLPIEELKKFLIGLSERELLLPEVKGSQSNEYSHTGMWKERRFLDAPIFVQFDVTNACNLHCAHCITSSGDALENELSTDEALKLIEELAELNVFQIGFSGGEVFVRKDIFQLMERAKELGIRVQVTTNATLVNHTIAERLSALELVTVGVSLEGATEESYGKFRGKENFKRALKGIKILLEYNLPVKIKTAVSRDNIDEMEDIVKLAVELGVKAVDMFLLYPEGRAESMKERTLNREEIKEFLIRLSELRKKYSGKIDVDVDDKPNAFLVDPSLNTSTCGAGVYWAEVLPNGDVVPCVFLKNWVAGNIRKESFREIWNSPLWESFRDRRELRGRCSRCEYSSSCGGGCRANAILMLGDEKGEDVLCFYEVGE